MTTEQRIPKRIIQTWKSKHLPWRYRRFQRKLKRLHPDYELLLFTDDEMHAFVREEYPQYAEVYDQIPDIVSKTDLFRLLAVHKLGGFYFDLDVLFVQPIDELRQHACVFPFQSSADAYFAAVFGAIDCLGQYGFGAEAGHPFMLACADSIRRAVTDPDWALVPGDEIVGTLATPLEPANALKIYYTTGPWVITRAFMDQPEARRDVKIISAFDEKHNRKVYYCFGVYGVHAMHGTWKGDKPWYIPLIRRLATDLALFVNLHQLKMCASKLVSDLPQLPVKPAWLPTAGPEPDLIPRPPVPDAAPRPDDSPSPLVEQAQATQADVRSAGA